MTSTLQPDTERLSNSIFLRCSGLNLKKTYGNPPDIRQYIAHSENELRIQAFNSTMRIPHCFATVDDEANWIVNSPELNPGKVLNYLTSMEGRSVLACLATKTCMKGIQNLVERLREFLHITGAVMFVGDVQTMPESLKVVLQEFSKAVVQSQPDDTNWAIDSTAVAQLCKCILNLNLAIIDGSETSSLPQFFASVRSLSPKATGLLAPRHLTDIYNTLRMNDPFVFVPKGDIFPSFLLSTPLWHFAVLVSFNGCDSLSSQASRWCLLTKDALYIFAEETAPWPDECVPLGWVRSAVSERRDGSCLELLSRGGSNPLVPVISTAVPSAPTLSYHSCILLQFATPADCEESRSRFERAIWNCARLVNKGS